jgi:hypothetical protein
MSRLRLRVLMGLALVFGSQCGLSSTEKFSPAKSIHHNQISSDLANALAQVSHAVGMPMVAQLAQPLPKIFIAEGTHTTNYLLEEIIRQAPGYSWELHGQVVLIYSRLLKEAPFNPLTHRFARFSMPDNVSALKYMLPNLAATLLEEEPAKGIIMTGFGDQALEKESLQPSTLENVSGEEVLIRAMEESPTFSVVIVFASAKPTKGQALKAYWSWQSLKADQRPVYPDSPHDNNH